MAIPSGSGTEVLKRVTKVQSNAESTILTGVANHIYTVLGISFQDQQGVANTIHIGVHDGTQTIRFVAGQSVPASGTFVWNDKFVMEGDDYLAVYNSSTAGHWYVSYIDQDWT